jgi:hypothetical protein
MRRRLAILLLALLPGLQGCFLEFLTGHSFLEGGSGPGALRFFGYGRLSTCEIVEATRPLDPRGIGPLSTIGCGFNLTGGEGSGSENNVDSVFSLPGALAQLLNILDPVIIQVPAGYGQVAGTWQFSDPLAIQSGLASVEVQPGVFLAAEPGHELVIVDFPAGPLNVTSNFELSIKKPASGGPAAPIPVKVMTAAKVEVDGKPYYLPLLPCVADFASIPAITVPASPTGQDLVGPLLAALSQSPTKGCQNVTYGFTATTTTLPAGETCGNCLDDDGDGLVDFDDPQCCGGGSGPLTLARTRFERRKTFNTRVDLKGVLGPIDAFETSPSPAVQIQVREDGGETLWCVQVPADRLKGKKLSRRFRDRTVLAQATKGLQDLRLQGRKKDGTVKIAARAKLGMLRTPNAGRIGITVALRAANAAPETSRCHAALQTFRTKKGGVRFP